uniref:Serine protease 23 n=1 Tax=Cyprinus carpio TaxID=7962 RepID=A0A8C1XSW4_CYPCA
MLIPAAPVPIQHVPVVWPQQSEKQPPPYFLQSAELEVTSSCGPECHKRAPQPSYWDLRQFLSYETLHSNGQLTETAVGTYGFDANAFYETPAGHSRSKHQIFGHDSRFSIVDQDFLLKYRFSTAVKSSTGCTGTSAGTLMGDRHILTAAQCIHDGKNYVKGAQRLRVGFLKPQQKDMLGRNSTNTRPDNMKFQWSRVKCRHIPKGWIKGTANDIGMDYDYALLELKKAHKRRHMKLGISPAAKKLPGNPIQFSGFDNDRPGQLVYRFCEAGDETYDLLFQHCDAQPATLESMPAFFVFSSVDSNLLTKGAWLCGNVMNCYV